MTKLIITTLLFFSINSYLLAENQFKEAESFIDEFSNEAINILSNDSLDENKKSNLFTSLVMNSIDLNLISKFVLSKAWKNATNDEKERYINAFKEYFVNSYSNKLNQYSGEKVKISGSSEVGKYIIVESSVIKEGMDNLQINISWRVIKKDNEFKIIDLNIEGISLVIAQREEFQSFLLNNDFNLDLLISELEKINN